MFTSGKVGSATRIFTAAGFQIVSQPQWNTDGRQRER